MRGRYVVMVCCNSNIWFTFCHCYHSVVCISWWIRPHYNGTWLCCFLAWFNQCRLTLPVSFRIASLAFCHVYPRASETILRNVDIYGLMQGRRNSIANALELRLPCTNPSIWYINHMSPLKTDTYNWNKSKQYKTMYCQTSNISHNLVGNVIVDLSDVVGASPVGDAPTTSSFST